MNDLPDLLRTRRLTLGETQRQAARRIGVTQSSYSRWESGRTTPDPARLDEIAASLDLPTESLVRMLDGAKRDDDFAAVRNELDALRRDVAELRARLEGG